MALGKPPITTPRNFELSAIASAISNIRERMEASDAVVKSLSDQAAASTTQKSINNLTQQLTQLRAQVDALAQAVRVLSSATPAAAQVTYILAGLDAEDGEDGMTIPGPAGPPGVSPPPMFIEGEPGEDAPYLPPM